MSTEMKVVDALRSDPSPAIRGTPPLPPQVDQRSLAQLLVLLFRARILIGVITLAFVLLGILYLEVALPIYRSDVTVQVEETTRTIAGLSELSTILSSKAPADTEMEILRSRGLLGQVVEQLNLDIVAAPERFPVVGAALARRYRGAAPAPAPLNLTSYAWGGERIAVPRLAVPDKLLNLPLTLIAARDGDYEMRGPAGEHILTGTVGKAALQPDATPAVEIFVSQLVARPGTRFTVMKRTRLRVIEALQTELRIEEKGRSTGVLMIALDGQDPAKNAAILDAIAGAYQRQNVERKSAEAGKTLEFLESQLPALKANLNAAETAFKGYQLEKGSIDLSRESQAMLDRAVEIEKALSEAELQRSELRHRFTGEHPALQALASKIERLHGEQNAINSRMRHLPDTELESARLTRDVKVGGDLYNLLLNKVQELRVVRSGTIGNVRILDQASVPDLPSRPMKALVALASVLLGFTAGVAAAIMRRSLYIGVDDPELIEHATGIAVFATVPRSASEARLDRRRKPGAQRLLASIEPHDPAVEAIRSLRTSLQFALVEAKNNIIAITGPTADAGKSFVTANLGYVMAAADQRVLIVDGDLRLGSVHRFFGGERHPGLSDVLSGNATLAEAVQTSPFENLRWLPTGRIPPNPADLLASDRFERILAELSSLYDLVLVDTPPVLAVTDAALIGQFAATTLLVLRAGAHPLGEVLFSVKRLAQNGVRVRGVVLNDCSGAAARYGKNGYQYNYRYGRDA